MLQRGAECRSEERKGPSPRRTWGGREDAQRLQQLCWEERLRELGLWSLEKAAGGPRCGLPVPKGASRKAGGDLHQGVQRQDKG